MFHWAVIPTGVPDTYAARIDAAHSTGDVALSYAGGLGLQAWCDSLGGNGVELIGSG